MGQPFGPTQAQGALDSILRCAWVNQKHLGDSIKDQHTLSGSTLPLPASTGSLDHNRFSISKGGRGTGRREQYLEYREIEMGRVPDET